MKKINVKKINKEVLELHLEYCKRLRPEIIGADKNYIRRSIDEDLVRFLCCEDPFDFDKHNHNYLKDEYLDFYKKSDTFNKRNIDYRAQYKNFRTRIDTTWNGTELIKTLGTDICPYCGMNYITSVTKKNGNIKTTASLDHYLPEGKYPFLAMNIYNLIPSCRNCNSIFKYKAESAIVYPFKDALEDLITFNITDPDSVIDTIINKKTYAPVKVEILSKEYNKEFDKKFERLINHLDIMALEERYNVFQNMIKTIILKKYEYNKSYLKQNEKLGINLKKHLEKFLIRQDMLSDDEVFLKFKQDIWNQLGDNQYQFEV